MGCGPESLDAPASRPCLDPLDEPFDGPGDRLSPQLVRRSILLARRYLLAIQKDGGNFVYELDLRSGKARSTDNDVRQAGTSWALVLAHRACASAKSRDAVVRMLQFWWDHSQDIGAGRLAPFYGQDPFGDTGLLALLTLTHIEALQADLPEDVRPQVRTKLDGYLTLLLSLRNEDGHFDSRYSNVGHEFGRPNAYYDGESLLAITRAAREAGYDKLQPLIMASAEVMHRRWVVQAAAADPDHPAMKGFFHWGIMAYDQIVDSGWEGSHVYAQRAVDLAVWMVDVHRTLQRTRNTGYAYEGIIPAWRLAGRLGRQADQRKLAATIEQGLLKLCTWQVGSPVANPELAAARAHRRAIGGVMNRRFDPWLRNDTTQHQLNALLLADRVYYGQSEGR